MLIPFHIRAADHHFQLFIAHDGDLDNCVVLNSAGEVATGGEYAAIKARAKLAKETASTLSDTANREMSTAYSAATDIKSTYAIPAQTSATTAQTNANSVLSTAQTNFKKAESFAVASQNMTDNEVSYSNLDFSKFVTAINSSLTYAMNQAARSAENYDYAGFTIATQEDAQKAIEALNNAIVMKDKIRADLGALQNRLENTITNLNTQAENLQAAESRISDVDVATEMTEFTRQQILSQSAVAMLAQANSLPQMAMQLIGG